MKRSLKAKMIFFFLVVVAVSAVGFGLVWLQLGDSSATLKSFHEQDLPRLQKTYALSSNSQGQVSNIRGYFMYGKPELLANFRELGETNRAIEAELMETARTEEGKRLSSKILELDTRYNEMAENQLIPLLEAGNREEAMTYAAMELTPVGAQLVDAVKEYQTFRDERTAATFAEVLGEMKKSRTETVIFSLASVVLGILIGVAAARNISRPLEQLVRSAEEIASGDLGGVYVTDRDDEIGALGRAFQHMKDELRNMVKHISQEAEQVAAASEELSATSQQSAAASEELAKTITEIAQGATDQAQNTMVGTEKLMQLGDLIEGNQKTLDAVRMSSDQVGSLVQAGLQTVEILSEKTNESNQAAGHMMQNIQQTHDSSERIGAASSLIASIAEQTNLLALNAAIEAARAGEHGRGFSVVADEIRKLAEQSTQSTKVIDEMVREVKFNAAGALETMRKVGVIVQAQSGCVMDTESSFREISEAIQMSKHSVSVLAESGQQMTWSKNDVHEAMQSLSAIAQENAAGSEEASASIEEQSASMEEIANACEGLSALAMKLQGLVSKFKL